MEKIITSEVVNELPKVKTTLKFNHGRIIGLNHCIPSTCGGHDISLTINRQMDHAGDYVKSIYEVIINDGRTYSGTNLSRILDEKILDIPDLGLARWICRLFEAKVTPKIGMTLCEAFELEFTLAPA